MFARSVLVPALILLLHGLLVAGCNSSSVGTGTGIVVGPTPPGGGSNTSPVQLTSPDGGELLRDVVTITWRNLGASQVNIFLVDAVTGVTQQVGGAPADLQSFTWNTRTAPDGRTYRIRLDPQLADGRQALSDSSLSVFTIDNVAEYTLVQQLGNGSSQGGAVGDVDGDGDQDLVFGNQGSGNRVYLNDGAGAFTDTGQSLGLNATQAVALGDVDQDGDLDLVAANTAGPNRVWLNDGGGTFTDSGQTLGISATRALALGDLDSDGDLDIVAGNDNLNRIYLNDGAGVFSVGPLLGTGNTRAVVLADVDQDGDLDLLVGNLGGPNQVWLNDGVGNLTDSGQTLGIDGTQAIAVGDLDGDGDLDHVVGNAVIGNRIYFNDGAGTYTDSGRLLGVSGTRGVALVDIDLDGDLDLLAANDGTPDRVYLNDGAGVFTDTAQSLLASSSSRVALAQDFDGDGDPDLVVASVGPNLLWLNE